MFNGFDAFDCIGVWSGFERRLRRFLGFGSAGMATEDTTPRVAGAIFDPICSGCRVVEVVIHVILGLTPHDRVVVVRVLTLRRSRVGDSRIKRPPCVGLPQAADRSRGGSSRAGKQPPHATKVAQAATSHASNDSPRIPAVASQRLAIAQAIAVR
ncbi:hypothetical protein GW17_00009232 [Ensete ventricosum]|nr:hypothetical protein GW17_00009232 [Ensete ventricosum]RZS13927.1 hypothetical protein BHM03_00045596 [Ensete ventricosum]